MSNDFYSKGTIKIKNADGVVEPFLPVTDFSCIDDANGKALTETISSLTSQVETAENSGGIEILYEEPNEDNTERFSNETMVAWIEIDENEWIFLVDTRTTKAGNKTGIPFNLYGQSATMTVEWGDGTSSILSSSDYALNDATASVHEYEVPGIYKVRIVCNNWNNVYFLYNMEAYSSNPYDKKIKRYVETDPEVEYNSRKSIYYWQHTLIEILSPIPEMNGCQMFDGSTYTNSPTYRYTSSLDSNSSYYYSIMSHCINLSNICSTGLKNIKNVKWLFAGCISLKTINSLYGISDENAANITKFFYTFDGCSALTSIPEDIFNKFINVTSFESCFSSCTSLQSIPENLFKCNTKAINFSGCFVLCLSLTSIPENLFRYNTLAENFSSCFSCTSFNSFSSPHSYMNIESIPENLFRYNTAVTNLRFCFNSCTKLNDVTLRIGSPFVNDVSSDSFMSYYFMDKKEGANRIIYVPSGSTTEGSFNSIASELGLTIIGE